MISITQVFGKDAVPIREELKYTAIFATVLAALIIAIKLLKNPAFGGVLRCEAFDSEGMRCFNRI